MAADTFRADLAEATGRLREAAASLADRSQLNLRIYDGGDRYWEQGGGSISINYSGFFTERINDLFSHWYTLPDPSGFDGPIEALDASVSQMTAEEVVELEDARSGLGTGTQILELSSAVQINVKYWKGDFMREFRRRYSNRFDLMIAYQSNLASVLARALEIEKETFTHARQDVLDLVEQAIEAIESMDNCWFGSSAQKNATFTVLSAVSGSLVGFATAGPVGALAGAAVSAAGGFVEVEAPEELPLGGSTLMEVWENLGSGLDKINDDINTAENRLNEILGSVYYSLSNQVPIGTDDDTDDVSVLASLLLRPPPPGEVSEQDLTSEVAAPDNYTHPDDEESLVR